MRSIGYILGFEGSWVVVTRDFLWGVKGLL